VVVERCVTPRAGLAAAAGNVLARRAFLRQPLLAACYLPIDECAGAAMTDPITGWY
jgi:hypothetical protein